MTADDPPRLTVVGGSDQPRPPDETVWERRYKAATLRNSGATITAIAAQLGISTGTVRKDIALVLHEAVQDSLEDMVARQRTVLADMQRAVYRQAILGDTAAVQQVLRILDHEAKLRGLYAPERVNLGISDMEYAQQVADLIVALRPDTIRELTRGHIDAEVVTDVGLVGDPDTPGADPDPADAPPDQHRNGHRPAGDQDPLQGQPWSNL